MKMKADLDIIEFECLKLELLDPENYEAEAKALYDLLSSTGRVLRSNIIFIFVP